MLSYRPAMLACFTGHRPSLICISTSHGYYNVGTCNMLFDVPRVFSMCDIRETRDERGEIRILICEQCKLVVLIAPFFLLFGDNAH